MDISERIAKLKEYYGKDLTIILDHNMCGCGYYEEDPETTIITWDSIEDLDKKISELKDEEEVDMEEEEIKAFCCYKVKCKTVKENKNLTRATWMVGDDNLECKSGNVYIITDDPRTIYDTFEDVISIKNIGVGYTITNDGI